MWRTGLQRKFLIALLLVGILPGITALFVTYWSSTRSLKQSIGSGFQEIARSSALRIAATVDGEIDRAERLAIVPIHVRRAVELANRRLADPPRAPTSRHVGPNRARGASRSTPPSPSVTDDYLRSWAAKTDYYVRVTVTDQLGRVVGMSDPSHTPLRLSDQVWWQEAMRGGGKAYVSTFRLTPDANEYVFDVAVPIRGADGETPLGVVNLLVRRDALMKTILTIRVGETGHGMLVDTDGTPLICPVLPPTSHLIHQALLNQFSPETASWFVAEDDAHGDHNTIVGAAPVRFIHPLTDNSLGGTAWFAFVRQQAEETYAPIYSLLTTVGAIGLALVLGLASLGYVIGHRIVAPIVTLRRETEELRRRFDNVAQSPLSVEPEPITSLTTASQATDEIQDLARTFMTMRAALEQSLATIQTQQEQLVRRERLASVGQLLAALAHDLRNPLGVIRSSAQLILDRKRDDTVKEEVARYIIEEVDRLTHRINDFLRYARQKPPEPVDVAAERLLCDALEQWRAQGGHQQISVETHFTPGLPPIQVDPSQVKEALVNVLINAREAMPDGGMLTIATRRAASGAIEMAVEDTGCGISEAHLRRIFEPFFTTKEYGTGLGLTNVKRLVEDNGGTLHIASHEAVGTVCTMYFPTFEVRLDGNETGSREIVVAVADTDATSQSM